MCPARRSCGATIAFGASRHRRQLQLGRRALHDLLEVSANTAINNFGDSNSLKANAGFRLRLRF